MGSTRVDVDFVVDARAETVMAALADLGRMPEWSSLHRNVSVESVDAQGRPARLTVDASFGPLVDHELIEYEWDGIARMSWNVVQSTYLAVQRGSYTLRADGERTRVTMAMEIEAKFAAPRMMVKGVQLAASRTASKRFKAFAEGYSVARG
ncbi:SRPBCC family protein [Nocardia sp. NPDC004068]|uniref:SRPBCC family protein n=1 Tax=Nocardia sp. NPDC004068 TaxID=3364303 RepID=UPI0036776C30